MSAGIDINDFTVFHDYGLTVTNIETLNDTGTFDVYGTAHQIQVHQSQRQLEITMVGSTGSSSKIGEMRDDLKLLRELRDSQNVAVQKQFAELKILLELSR